MVTQKMFLNNVKEEYGVDNKKLAQVLKCSEERVIKLESLSAEITTNDFIRICNYFNIQGTNMDLFAQYSILDNFFTRKLRENEKR